MKIVVSIFALLLSLCMSRSFAQAPKADTNTDSLFLRIGDSILLGRISSASNEIQLPNTRFDWAKNYPNLRTLHGRIHYRALYFSESNKIITNILKLPKLEELVFYSSVYWEFTIPKPLPNLKRLSIDGSIFPAYLYQLPNIEELILDCSMIATEQTPTEYAKNFQKWLLQTKHLRVLQFYYPIANFQGTTAPASPTEGHTLTHLLVGDNGALVQAILKGQQHLFPNLHTIYWSANYDDADNLMSFLNAFPSIQTLYLNVKTHTELESILTTHKAFFQRLRVLYVPNACLTAPHIEQLRQRIIPNTQLIGSEKLLLVDKPFKF